MPEISETNNPLEIIKSFKENGFLSFVLPDGVNVSEKTVDLSAFLSNRERQQGRGEFQELEIEENLQIRFLFRSMLLRSLKALQMEQKHHCLMKWNIF